MPRTNDLTSVILGSSRSSFVNTICKFVRDVDEMNETVMIPSLLTDLNNNSSTQPSTDLPECFDLQTLHQLLNRLKDELTIARFEDDQSKSCNFTSANNILSINNCNNNINNNTNNNRNNNQINVNSNVSTTGGTPLRIAEGDLSGLSKKLSSSCKCSDSDDGFSSLNSYSRNSDDESTGSSPSSDSDSECCSSSSSTSSSTPNQSRENEPSIAESSPEYIVNLLRLHIQGIQSILTRFSKSADQISESYINSIN
ncbi:5'-AMP-activated serine/threonine-protein kinase catalytic subunit alpha [Tetranychus urticae]|uniref:Uncharacterized protein n=1 Tax=Tetranychus urticae TaxID=32264 RepID=T1KKR5_TETUR|nr:5'-AMP-activated serine/threonine-protein kinase catalytic subunit alpha [Tetranychus urticae]